MLPNIGDIPVGPVGLLRRIVHVLNTTFCPVNRA
ncbi:hypothetical protein T10_2634 [Trichinella papuae]|uniref:Uncharacterized protein n=1 Tax=Trichinella papuae TaxID=268474 RepID=A0A0V1LWW6_9BILA|nr:hypothetical protein T10_2634 [Trichinella papuae]